MLAEFGGQQFSVFKPALADLAVSVLSPINDRMKALMAEPDVIDDILAKGSERAAAIASKVMDDVRDIVGFIQSRKRR